MATTIKTAEEVVASITRHRKMLTKERREFLKAQSTLEAYEDLRDDVMSLVKNSGMSYQDIHARCGPTPQTLEKWANKSVHQPKLGKMRAVLRILDHDFGVVNRGVKH